MSTALNKSQPPAWASNLIIALTEQSLENQILQQILQMAETNAKIMEEGAQANGNAQMSATQQQGQATMYDAYSTIGNGTMTLGGELSNTLANNAIFNGKINAAQAKVDTVNEWDETIKAINAGDRSGQPANDKFAIQQAKYEISFDGQPGNMSEEELTALRSQNGSKTLDKTTAQKLAQLQKNNLPAYQELEKNIANNKEKLEKNLSSIQNEKESWKQRASTYINGLSQTIAGGIKTHEGQIYEDMASIQLLQKIAEYFSTTANAAQQTILGQKDQMYGLMTSTGDNLINKLADANRMS